MGSGGEPQAGSGSGNAPVPGQGDSAPHSRWVGEQWGVEGWLEAQPRAGETSGGSQRRWCCTTQRPWDRAALGTGAFCHGVDQVWCWIGAFWAWRSLSRRWDKRAPASPLASSSLLRPAHGCPRADPESVLLLGRLLSVCPSFHPSVLSLPYFQSENSNPFCTMAAMGRTCTGCGPPCPPTQAELSDLLLGSPSLMLGAVPASSPSLVPAPRACLAAGKAKWSAYPSPLQVACQQPFPALPSPG